MRIRAFGDVLKVWLYAAAVVALGAWLAPLLFNAGKALAEVSSSRVTNDPLKWLGAHCQKADFPQFFTASLLLAAAVLFFPWLRWLRPKPDPAPPESDPATPDEEEAAAPKPRPACWNIIRGTWHGSAGFLLVAEMWLALAGGLVLTGFFRPHHPTGGWETFVLSGLASSFALAVLLEVFFRGWVMAVFLRAMRPAVAIGMNAVFFALAFAVLVPHRPIAVDPETAGAGFRLLRLMADRTADWPNACEILVPLLALGGVLAYARWRTAALWLPIGLHTGWLFAREAQVALLDPIAGAPYLTGGPWSQGWIPAITIVLAGMLARRFTANPPS